MGGLKKAVGFDDAQPKYLVVWSARTNVTEIRGGVAHPKFAGLRLIHCLSTSEVPLRMRSCPRSARFAAVFTLALACSAALAAPQRAQLHVNGYVIHADIDPAAAKLTATAAVTFTAVEDLTNPVFELNNGLALTKVTDASGATFPSERLTFNSTVRFTLQQPIAKGTTTTWTFTYAGVLTGSDTSPVEGIKLAAIADPISILLYPGAWFPMSPTGLYTDRFTAEMHIRVPSDERVVGSGAEGKGTPVDGNKIEYTFKWAKPGFPGTIIAGKFLPPFGNGGMGNVRMYVTEKRKAGALEFAALAGREFEFMTLTFGEPESGHINIVEMPEDAVSAAWGPEVIAIAGHRIVDRNSQRLLANTLAHQWWGRRYRRTR